MGEYAGKHRFRVYLLDVHSYGRRIPRIPLLWDVYDLMACTGDWNAIQRPLSEIRGTQTKPFPCEIKANS
jgi:hypothetical protein